LKPSTEASRLLNKLEKGFTVLILLLSTGGLLPVLRGVEGVGASGHVTSDPISQAIWLALYVVTFTLVAAQWKRFVNVATRDTLLLLLVSLALVSVLWSVAPEVTARRGFALVGTVLIGIYFAMRYSLSEQLRLIAWALGIAAVLSLVFALALPSYGISGGQDNPEHAGAWQGIFVHKNTLGGIMTLSALVFLLLGLSSHKYRKFIWAGFGLSVGLIVLSNSQSSLVIFLTLLILLPLYSVLRRHYPLIVSVSITFILLVGSASIWILVNLGPTLATLGRDTTLSGRTELWAAVLDMIWRNVWLGTDTTQSG